MITAVSFVNQSKSNRIRCLSKLSDFNFQTVNYIQNDSFHKAQNISFGSSFYDKVKTEQFIDDILNKRVFTDKRGFQGEFFRFGDKYGIKSPNPLDKSSPFVDFLGENNVREFYILKHIKSINPKIATSPVDIINKNGKFFLVTDFIQGVHPFDCQMNSSQFQDIIKKIFELDINGVYHCDLQSGNIFLNNNNATFIDFGAYDLLSNKGNYVSSDSLPISILLNNDARTIHNSHLDSKFLATFYDKTQKNHLIAYSDNPYLNIKSNISNLEYRLIYDYLKNNKSENPKNLFVDYLKSKSKFYNEKMIPFLQDLKIETTDVAQIQQRENAVNTEKLFSKIYSNPSDNVIKAELEKIQLKWLINDYQGAKTKAFDFLNKYLSNIENYLQHASSDEKPYFDTMKKMLEPYKNFLNKQEFNTHIFDNKDCITNVVFGSSCTTVDRDTVLALKDKIKHVDKSSKNNKFAKIFLALLLLTTAVVVILRNKNNKK